MKAWKKERNEVVIYHAMTWPQVIGMSIWIAVMIGFLWLVVSSR